jgi:hypothetical protein
MISDIQNWLSFFKDLRGLRNILWALLIFGVSLVVIESVTQYFSVSSLKTKTELLESLSKIETDPRNKQKIASLHSALIEETKEVYQLERNPSLYLLNIFLKFFQGAYLSFPLFYFFFKGVTFFYRNADKFKQITQAKQFALGIGSFVFSIIVWMATVLGVASVLWNKSDSLLVTWVIFPASSAVVLLVLLVWLLSLRILLPGKKSTELKE